MYAGCNRRKVLSVIDETHFTPRFLSKLIVIKPNFLYDYTLTSMDHAGSINPYFPVNGCLNSAKYLHRNHQNFEHTKNILRGHARRVQTPEIVAGYRRNAPHAPIYPSKPHHNSAYYLVTADPLFGHAKKTHPGYARRVQYPESGTHIRPIDLHAPI